MKEKEMQVKDENIIERREENNLIYKILFFVLT